jgi:hypothetical protein
VVGVVPVLHAAETVALELGANLAADAQRRQRRLDSRAHALGLEVLDLIADRIDLELINTSGDTTRLPMVNTSVAPANVASAVLASSSSGTACRRASARRPFGSRSTMYCS